MYIRSFVVWVVMIVAETIHGILRRLFLLPIAGEIYSNQIGVFIGSLIILIVARIFYDWIRADSVLAQVKIGALWCLLTFGFEFGLGLAFGYSVHKILKDYDLSNGGLMLIGMMILASSLVIVSKLRVE